MPKDRLINWLLAIAIVWGMLTLCAYLDQPLRADVAAADTQDSFTP